MGDLSAERSGFYVNSSQPYVGRLAPSPTGLLHLGHAATFSIAGARARATSGRLFLRIDDLDRQRSNRRFTEAAKQDLQWLGLEWDTEVQQSDRVALYRKIATQLLEKGFIYPCVCSRKDLQQAIQAPHEETDDEPVYNGRCRPLISGGETTLKDETNYRFRVPDGKVTSFMDGHCGPQHFLAGCSAQADFGDFVVWRKDGLPSYQLACVVDDAGMGITEVVRGRDLLKSTARQIVLQQALGLPTPAYFHTELLRDANGERLAKRHDALSLRTLREQGYTPAEVRTLAEGLASEGR